MSKLERSLIIVVQGGSIRFPINSSVLKAQSLKCYCRCRKSGPNLELFDSLV